MRTVGWTLFIFVLLGAAIAPLAAPQDRTARPGDPTQARVWIENRGASEAVPVVLQSSDGPPLRVELAGQSTVSVEGVIPMRLARESWEDPSIALANGQDPVATLNAAGSEGWELTGLAIPTQGGITVIVKRPQ